VVATIPADLSPEQERVEQSARSNAAQRAEDRCVGIVRRELVLVMNMRDGSLSRAEVERILSRILRDIHTGAVAAGGK